MKACKLIFQRSTTETNLHHKNEASLSLQSQTFVFLMKQLKSTLKIVFEQQKKQPPSPVPYRTDNSGKREMNFIVID